MSKLIVASLAVAIAAWLVLLVGLGYSQFFLPNVDADPRAIMSPAAFVGVTVILAGFWLSCLGLLLASVGVFFHARGKALWVAIFANGVYCLPVAALLLRQFVL